MQVVSILCGVAQGCVYLWVNATPQAKACQGVKVRHDGDGMDQFCYGPTISTNQQTLQVKKKKKKKNNSQAVKVLL